MPKETTTPILVGCELFVRNLFGLRKNCYGAGNWGLPGGHLEFNERLVNAMCREAAEEMGATIAPHELTLVSVVDGLEQVDSSLHYIHISFEIKDPKWEPRLAEPERCEAWRYFPLDDLPKLLFGPRKDIVKNYLANRLYNY
jgi:8-oxo-dGTP diphosphatase